MKVGKSTYTGTWDDEGKLSGLGTIENDNNMGSFKGMFSQGLREGEGSYIWPNNQGEYKGMYRAGLRDTGDDGPDSTMIWRDGGKEHVYVGKWAKGQCTKGTLDGNQVDQKPP